MSDNSDDKKIDSDQNSDDVFNNVNDNNTESDDELSSSSSDTRDSDNTEDAENGNNGLNNDFDDNDFDAKSEIDENANDEKFLNKKTVEYVPTAVVYTIMVSFVGIGAVVGFVIGDFSIGGLLCLLETMSQVTADPTSLSSEGDLIESMRKDLTACTIKSVFTPLPLLTGLAGSIFGSYPGYKAAKLVSGGKHLRSII